MLASDPSGFRVPAPADLIQVSPLSVESWEQLLGKVRGQGDPLSTRTLEVIVEGLREIGAVSGSATPPHLSTSALGIFARLAKAYNSPTLLKEAGLIYLRELGLPEVAQRHFERALRLGGPEKELRPLAETAAVEVQRKRARPSEAEAVVEAETVAEDAPTTGFSGIVTMQPMKKIVPDGISHTGCCCPRWRRRRRSGWWRASRRATMTPTSCCPRRRWNASRRRAGRSLITVFAAPKSCWKKPTWTRSTSR
jgi:hypothetical protein